ncbi:hypothetical protein EV363DRAFT_1258146 [Boletus edulis]|uniref:Uncharacterized protein n=1 Tax=Boletus edulis BED1 TaxID=1328754 RepID=A0AAD4BY83_BOLED|nr:hypothetical protein EV363DRAFT_1258146 [Boletus edulis]KAF8442977.1 hypothetical protein L210DRAFT_3445682 [Boletus edulis BED1]
MTILDNTGESELVQLLNTIHELTEQLAQNRALSIALHTSAEAVKTQAAHSQTGFVLRRYNLDKPQDVYDAELERMDATLAAENQGLLHDNKQLGVLIKEYEQTLESVMGAFRTRARDVQEHELALIREYEARLLAKESENLLRVLSSTIAESISLGRVSAALRSLLRVVNGEDVPFPPSASPPRESDNSPLDGFDFGGKEDEDWALERECELSRLERENAVLRHLLGLDVREPECLTRIGPEGTNPIDQQRGSVIARQGDGTVQKKMLGGAPGTVGPYGTYKRSAGRPG